MNVATLHALANEMSNAFMGEVPKMTTTQRIVELGGGQWVGLQSQRHIGEGPIALFRDPVTGSTCCLIEEGLTVTAVVEKLESKRVEFGKGVRS